MLLTFPISHCIMNRTEQAIAGRFYRLKMLLCGVASPREADAFSKGNFRLLNVLPTQYDLNLQIPPNPRIVAFQILSIFLRKKVAKINKWTKHNVKRASVIFDRALII